MQTIIGGVISLAAMFFGNALLAKWLGAARLWWDSKVTPELKKATEEEYQRLNKQLGDILNRPPPI